MEVFFDPTRKRWRRLIRVGTALGVATAAVAAVFLFTLLLIPVLPGIPGLSAPARRALRSGILPKKDLKIRRLLLERSRKELLEEITAQTPHPGSASAGGGSSLGKKKEGIASGEIVGAFYATWQEEGLHSLRANADKLTHLFPEWVHLSRSGTDIDLRDWDPATMPRNLEAARIAREHGVAIWPVFNNAEHGDFDPERARRLLAEPARQRKVAAKLADWAASNGFQGLNFDFENLSGADYRKLPQFLAVLRRALRAKGLSLSMDVEDTSTALDWAEAAKYCDAVVVMAYDEHETGSKPGPIASFRWYARLLDRAAREIPREKLVIGLGSYAYDWKNQRPPGRALSYQQALLEARDNSPDTPASKLIDFDPRALNPTFNYADERGRGHEVWLLDGVTAANQWRLARPRARGAALWLLGTEDPSIWSFLDRERLAKPPSLAALSRIAYPYEVEYVGEGEILNVEALPQEGLRKLDLDPKTGFCVDERYDRFATAFVIKRRGLARKSVALTFDDGPSEPYTASILDALKRLNAKATFFVIGQNVENQPELVARAWREGHEIGNHTFTHPNVGNVSERRFELELTATERALQSVIGRSTALFRPPYRADAEPTSAGEVKPIERAGKLGYVTVGEFVDPRDWELTAPGSDGEPRELTADDIASRVVEQVREGRGNVVLLHDGGGDRTLTVEALDKIVPRLRREGYRFVTISSLAGTTRDSLMPPVPAKENALIGVDRAVFEAGHWGGVILSTTFLFALILAFIKVALVSTLAIIAWRRSPTVPSPPPSPINGRGSSLGGDFCPPVGVLIAAHDEHRVIVATLSALLASDYPDFEVVVVDDGSTDGTSEEIKLWFADEPRLKLLRQENHGKAAALNAAAAVARADILVCLDADTLFEPLTLARLVRRFDDPAVGAVAGQVEVGNRRNLLTRLQAIEYLTNQNIERRAFAMLNAVTVVPGAAGAWRRKAVESVGGFQAHTLAEDMDLTWRLRLAGWRIAVEPEARALTEAPETFRGLFKQRFRWVHGTLQCLWRHRDAVGRYGWFGRLVLPYLWVFQIAFQALSPIVDLQMLVAVGGFAIAWLLRGPWTKDWQPAVEAGAQLYRIGFLYALFCLIELSGALLAFRMERRPLRQAFWALAQRFVYRQLMYAVVWRSLKTAVQGARAGWGKVERRGTVIPLLLNSPPP